MKLTFLGTGTSTGIPQIGCTCEVCTSADPHDNRLRTSALLESNQGNNILIDCGPDFREQMIRAGAPKLTAAIITHTHYDHVGGIDDMRPYCAHGKFNVYCRADVADDLRSRVPYCFKKNPYPGVPTFNLHEIEEGEQFSIGYDSIMPLRIMHAQLPILGFRLENLGYVTDCKTMPEETLEQLRGVDVLVINALRTEEHMSHMNLEQALEIIESIKPREAYLIHMSHHMGLHAEVQKTLPENVYLAYDGLTIEC